jgi:hypothetical protein
VAHSRPDGVLQWLWLALVSHEKLSGAAFDLFSLDAPSQHQQRQYFMLLLKQKYVMLFKNNRTM